MGKIKKKENVQFLFIGGLAEICFVNINSGNWVGISPWSSSKKVVAEPVINCNYIKETNRHTDKTRECQGIIKKTGHQKNLVAPSNYNHWVRCSKGDDEDQKDKICKTISVTSVSTTKSADVLSAPLQNFQMHNGHQPYNGW